MAGLTCSQYVVLGLIAREGPMTPYELKARVEDSVSRYWPIPHAQLYRDPPRLAELGLLSEKPEQDGRRRRVFHLTDAGRQALARWLGDPTSPPPETRNPSLLKLTFADLASPAEIAALAETQAARHRGWAQEYQRLLDELDPGKPGASARARLIKLGVQHEQGYTDFWESLAIENS